MLEKLKPCPFCGGDVKIINAEELTINHHRSGGERGMTCKDCIHYKVCWQKLLHVVTGMDFVYRYKYNHIERVCKDFKDRSRFVELPCTVGDKIYVPTRNFVSEYEISYFHIGKQGMWFNSDVIDGISTRLRIGDFDDIGKTVFLTREEAEQALKEREKNETT